ncbi:hypothetical protein MOF18_08360, partial [Bacillus licheniformis]|nr:hypothetical protein [Bacillus licheniformis]
FSPLTLMQKLSFLSQVILIFLPEIRKFLSRKNFIHIDEKKQKLASVLYPIALILTICMAYFKDLKQWPLLYMKVASTIL